MFTEISTGHYLVVSTALLMIGTLGVLARRNIVVILMSIELILNAVNINLIAFSNITETSTARSSQSSLLPWPWPKRRSDWES
jgi:NADH:ubiquinone oxidoreductase subunit K